MLSFGRTCGAALLMLAVCLGAVAQSNPSGLKPSTQEEPINSMQRARQLLPQLRGLNDVTAVEYIHEAYYPDLPIEDVARQLGVQLPPPPPLPRKLGFIDKWRYEFCQTNAAKAPTPLGVNTGLRICKERFGQ